MVCAAAAENHPSAVTRRVVVEKRIFDIRSILLPGGLRPNCGLERAVVGK